MASEIDLDKIPNFGDIDTGRLQVAEGLRSVPSPVLGAILDALHHLKDGTIHRVAMNLLWARESTLGGEWPRETIRIDGTLSWAPDARQPLIMAYQTVSSCRMAMSLNDAGHQLWKRLHYPAFRLGSEVHWVSGMWCTCGRRSDRSNPAEVLRLHAYQETPRAAVWPVKDIDGSPYFIICPRARHVEDPMHAPGPGGGDYCLCGADLREVDLKFLSCL